MLQHKNVPVVDGASAGVHFLLSSMIVDEKDAFLVPVPQYPLYSAALALYGGTLIPYYLDESANWGVDVEDLQRLMQSAQERGQRVRGLVVINPGNPTGQVLSLANQVCFLCCLAGLRGAW
jgi:aspartate/methionine/tyrosine aminotransferase